VKLRVTGKVAERFEKRGRTHVVMEIEMRTAVDNRPLVTYRDTIIVSYQSASERSAA